VSRRPIAYTSPGRFELYSHHSAPTFYPEETHDTVQVCIPFAGARYDVIRQSELGGRRVHRLGARDILVVPRDQQHAIDWRRDAHIFSAQLSTDFIERALDVSGLSFSDICVLRDPLLTDLAREASNVLRRADRPDMLLDALTTVIAYRIGAQALDGAKLDGLNGPEPFDGRQGRDLRDYVEAHLDKTIALSDLATLVGCSEWHFIRRFSATFGVSPHAYVTERRLERARDLLGTTDLPIIQIALEVGMTHSHFSRMFAQHVGVTPTRYRRSLG
jgi:AraC-like DNA-binding protein